MPTHASRAALIIATGSYHDPELRRLRAPMQDAGALTNVLSDATIGGFTVRQVIDQPTHVVTRAIEEFFADRSLSDVLLVHISCHGIKDDDGALYFAASNTEKKWLASTAVSARFLQDRMEGSRARGIILLLDCCYSGAFMPGAKGDRSVHVKDELGGRGRAILTASNAIEYAWEGDELLGEGQPSLFTAAVVQGLKTGEADRDHDGVVSIEDLYKHVYERVRESKRGQTPLMSALDIEADLYVARSTRPTKVETAVLPVRMRQRVEHDLASVRAGVVVDLRRLLNSGDGGIRGAAREALVLLSKDDSWVVSEAAKATLATAEPQAPVDEEKRPGESVESTPSDDIPAPRQEITPLPRRGADVSRPRRRRSLLVASLIIVPLALLSIGALVIYENFLKPTPPPTPPPGPTPAVHVLSIPSTQLWTDTAIDVTNGDRVNVTATGQVMWIADQPAVGPDGNPDPGLQQYSLLPSVGHAALVGKIGNAGPPFGVRSRWTATISNGGRLFLGVNDYGRYGEGVTNNSGSFAVRVEIQKA